MAGCPRRHGQTGVRTSPAEHDLWIRTFADRVVLDSVAISERNSGISPCDCETVARLSAAPRV